MKKYLAIFKISWSQELEYRFNFFLGRLRNIIVLLLLFYVWKELTYETGMFAGYTSMELITYIFAVNILRSIIFGAQSRQVAFEINNGWFSKYLIMPVNHFWYEFFRELAERSIHLLSAVFEVIIFALILKVHLFQQMNWQILLLSALACLLAMFLYFILSYLISMLAFWSREAMGPRFLFEWLLEFASGAYFPLDILPKIFFSILTCLPFMYLIYFPISAYLGKYSLLQIAQGIGLQIFCIAVFSVLTRVVWQRGLKKYTGEGM